MILPPEKRHQRPKRVDFSTPKDVNIVAIDGTWRRPCKLLDVSDGGAKLLVENIESLPAKEFFLLFATMGTAFRRCKLTWVNGSQMGVTFLAEKESRR